LSDHIAGTELEAEFGGRVRIGDEEG
jgi:hypothetical protein